MEHTIQAEAEHDPAYQRREPRALCRVEPSKSEYREAEADRAELLGELLTELAAIAKDPVPRSVQTAARAVFARSQPGRLLAAEHGGARRQDSRHEYLWLRSDAC